MCIVLCVHAHMQLHVCDVYMCVRASVCIVPHIKAEEAPQSINQSCAGQKNWQSNIHLLYTHLLSEGQFGPIDES